MASPADPPWEHSRFALRRGLVLPRRRIVFVPVPKSGTSSMRWTLADLAGLDVDRFRNTHIPDARARYAIHDHELWPPRNRWARLRPERRDRISRAEGWLRFTVVRNPWTRLWSSWQSKVLLQARTFPERFEDEPWWCGVPPSPAAVVEAFRAFVAALADPATRPLDPHWIPQSAILAEAPPLTHLGRTEHLADTYEVLGAHVGVTGSELTVVRRNRTPLPFTPAVYDEASRATVRACYRADFEQFDYPDDPGPDTGVDAWLAEHDTAIDEVLATVAERVAARNAVR